LSSNREVWENVSEARTERVELVGDRWIFPLNIDENSHFNGELKMIGIILAQLFLDTGIIQQFTLVNGQVSHLVLFAKQINGDLNY